MYPFRIWQDVYIVGGAEISHPYDCCVYVVDAGDLILIDTGAGMSLDRLVDNIYAVGLQPEKLNSVVVTHAHIDHIGALAQLKEAYNIKIIAHELETNAIESGEGIGAEFYGVGYRPCKVDIKIKDTEAKFHLGTHDFNTLHTPGHTDGSIVVYVDIAGKRVLFGQDIHGPYEATWGGNPKQAAVSLRKLIDLKADVLCEGHFGIYQPANEVEKYIESYLRHL